MKVSAAETFDTLVYERWLYTIKRVFRPTCCLYCFPYAGGSNTTYRDWVNYLPDDFELRIISLPGRGARVAEPFSHDLEVMSYKIADAIQALEHGQFAFFGHSMGAMLAHEVACRLRQRGARLPSHLFVSGRQAPHIQDSYRPLVAKMSDDVFESQVRLLNGIPDEISSRSFMMEYLLPILKADFIAVDQWVYTYKEPLPVPITALIGKDDPTTNDKAVLAWRDHTKSDFYSRTFPGDHFFIKPCEQAIVELIKRTLTLF